MAWTTTVSNKFSWSQRGSSHWSLTVNKGKDNPEDAGYHLHNITSHNLIFVPNFKILGAVVPEKSVTQISLCITLEWEREKKEIRRQNKFQHCGFLAHNILQPYVGVYKVCSWEICDEKLYQREWKKWTIQQVIPNVCTKFQNPKCRIPEKSLTQISLFITLEWEMKKSNKGEKKGKINFSIVVFVCTINFNLL